MIEIKHVNKWYGPSFQVLKDCTTSVAKGEVVVRTGWTGSPAEGGSGALLYVKDSGIGIPAEAQARIFEAFAQADGSTTRRFGGTGLGLNISQRLVELMGGRIALHSQPETTAGTEFSVQLPLLPASGVQAPIARNKLEARSRLRGAPASASLIAVPRPAKPAPTTSQS